MPEIKVVYWNVENFGSAGNNRGNSQPLCDFIASAVANVKPDVIFLQEVLQNGIQLLARLQQTLCALPAPLNNWHYDFVPGSLEDTQGEPPNAVPPFVRQQDVGFSLRGHNEGYAVLWNQNISKFIMQPCAPVEDPRVLPAPLSRRFSIANYPIVHGLSAVRQSFGVCTWQDVPAVGMGPVHRAYGQVIPPAQIVLPAPPMGGAAPPPVAPPLGTPWAGIRVPQGANSYILPARSVAPAVDIVNPVGGAVLLAANTGTLIPINLPQGTVIPVGTVIGVRGIQLLFPGGHAHINYNPVVVPGDYTIADALTLPVAETCVVPPHCIQLEVLGRPANAQRIAYDPVIRPHESIPMSLLCGEYNGILNEVHDLTSLNYTPPGAGAALFNAWAYMPYPISIGRYAIAVMGGSRRPAYSSLVMNNAAHEILQMVVYHAPSNSEPADFGIQMLGFARCLYRAYNWGGYAAPAMLNPPIGALPSPHHVRPPVAIPAANFVDVPNVIAGGDWNIEAPTAANMNTSSFNKLTRPFNHVPAAMAAMMPAPTNEGGANLANAVVVHPAGVAAMPAHQNTILRLTEPVIVGNPVLSANFDSYKTKSIDNIFYRINPAAGVARPLINHQFHGLQMIAALGLPPVQMVSQANTNVYDLVKAVNGNRLMLPMVLLPLGAVPPPDNFFIALNAVQSFAALVGALPAFAPAPGRIPQFLNRARLGVDVGAGQFTVAAPAVNIEGALVGLVPAINIHQIPGGVAAAAAGMVIPAERLSTEFIKKFVSDHFPVIFTLNF